LICENNVSVAAVEAQYFQMITSSFPKRPAYIVLAEDNPTTARLVEVALQRAGVLHHLQIVGDGDAAIAALERPSAPTDLLLLDLYMPGKNGFEVLAHVKGQEHLRRIPVVVFSSSETPEDVNRAYDLHANAYVFKDPSFHDMCRSVDATVQFWLRTAIVPHR
jgi:two-component system, chemotaxis family, response regulator Rcp1